MVKALKTIMKKELIGGKKRLNKDFPPAQYHLGVVYYNGEGVEQDYEKAIYWYNEADKQEDTIALHNLFKMKREENITVQFYLAKFYYDALYKMAAYLVLLDKEKIPDFDKEKIKYLLEQKEQGNIVAQVILAQLYKTGNGVEKNKQQAFSLFKIAVEQKDILAQYCLGLAYMEGQGTATNSEKACEQFQQIISQPKENKENKKPHYINEISFEKQEDTDKFTNYPSDIRQWIGLVARDKLSILHEKEAKQQLAAANQELESFMAMIAHKFRG